MRARCLAAGLAVMVLVAAGVGTVAVGADEESPDGPPDPPHRLYGTVTDGEGNAAAAVEVVVRHDGETLASALTDEDGYFDVTVADPDAGDADDTLTVAVRNRTRSVTFETGGVSQLRFEGVADTAVAAETAELTAESETNLTLDGGSVESVEVNFSSETNTTVGVRELVGTNETERLEEGNRTVVTTLAITAPGETETETELTITVDRARLEERGVDPGAVRISHYDGTEWRTLETTVAEVTDETVTVTGITSGFSLFAIVGPTERDRDGDGDDTGPGGGGGGGGGGAGVGELLDDRFVFDGPHPVERVTFDSPVGGSVEVSEVSPPSPADIRDAVRFPGDEPRVVDVVTAVDITPTSRTAEGTSATVELAVPETELSDPANAVIVHRTDGGWEPVDTTVRESGDGTVTLVGEVSSFSVFAVVETGAPQAATPTPAAATPAVSPSAGTPGAEPTPAETVSVRTRTPQPEPAVETVQPTVADGEAGGFPLVPLAGLAVVAAVVALLFVLRRRAA